MYTVREGALDQWVDEWRQHVLPLRRRFGFVVREAWVIPATNRFVWLLGYDADFDEADGAYYASAERAAVDPDPARLLEHVEHLRLDAVDLT